MRQGPLAVWPWLGLLLEDSLLATSAGVRWNEAGVRVRSVFPGSPAEEAGLAPGDRIVAIGARRVQDNFEALDAVLNLAIGSGIPIRVERGGATLSIGTMVGTRPRDPRPAPLVDLALHTGLQINPQKNEHDGPPALIFSSMSTGARRHMPAIEAEIFDEGPTLGSVLPGRDLLEGGRKQVPIASLDQLSSLLQRCFVHEQFVALIHWKLDGSKTLDRVHVHRKVYPAII
jgi:membrane-associated protease RseP (regulator of RpoE activity)